MAVKQRLSVYLDADMMARLEKLAEKERAAKSSVAEAAIISFLTADDADRWEAALTRQTRSTDAIRRQSGARSRILGRGAGALHPRLAHRDAAIAGWRSGGGASKRAGNGMKVSLRRWGEGWLRGNVYLERSRMNCPRIQMARINLLLHRKRANARPPRIMPER